MADDEENAKSVKEILAYKQKLAAVEKTMADFRRTNAKETENELAKQKKAIIDLWKSGELSNSQYQRALQKATRAQETIQRAANDGSLGSMRQFGSKASTMMSALSEKLGLDFASAGPIGIALWVAGLFDAQRVLTGWTNSTRQIFADGGASQGDAWAKAFMKPTDQMFENSLFVSDEMRGAFAKAGFAMGQSIKGIGGKEYQENMEKMLVSGQAFGVTADQMAAKLFHFTDVLRMGTKEAGDQVLKTVSVATRLKVAPEAFLSLTSDLTSAFKLQNLSLGSTIEVYEKYLRTANKGRLATEDLTKSTMQALGSMSSSKIAGLLTIAGGGGPAADLGKTLFDFYKGGKGAAFQGDRFKLLQAAFNEMRRKVPEAMEDSFKGTQLTMSLAGVTDMSTGVRLYELMKDMDKTGQAGKKAEETARGLLAHQTSAQEMAINFVVNGINMIVRLLTSLVAYSNSDEAAKQIGEQFNKVGTLQAQVMGIKQSGVSDQKTADLLDDIQKRGAYEQRVLDAQMKFSDEWRSSIKKQNEIGLNSGNAKMAGAFTPGGMSQQQHQIDVKDFKAWLENYHPEVKLTVEADKNLKVMAKSAEKTESSRGRR